MNREQQPKHRKRWILWSVSIVVLLALGYVALLQVSLKDSVKREEAFNSPERLTMSRLRAIEGVLNAFHSNCSTYPTTEQGIDALKRKPHDLDCPRYPAGGFVETPSQLDDVSKDLWGQTIKYSFDGHKYRLEASHGIYIEGP